MILKSPKQNVLKKEFNIFIQKIKKRINSWIKQYKITLTNINNLEIS